MMYRSLHLAVARRRRAHLALFLTLALSLFAAACGGEAYEVRYLDDEAPLDFAPNLDGNRPVDLALNAWFDGDVEAAQASLLALPQEDLLVRFALAEIAMQRGRFGDSFRAHIALIKDSPGHPLATVSAWRLRYLSGLVNDPESIADLFTLDWSKLHPETNVLLADLFASYQLRVAERGEEPVGSLLSATRPGEWRWVGPFAFYALAGFEQAYPPEQADHFEDFYHWNGRTIESRQSADKRGPFAEWPHTGVYYMESYFEVSQEQEAALFMESATSTAVWIDGELVLLRDESAGYPTTMAARLLKLAPGRHRILVKHGVGGVDNTFSIHLVPLGQALPFAFEEATPGETAGVELGLHLRMRGQLPNKLSAMASDPFSLWLTAILAGEVGDYARGRYAIEVAQSLAERFAPLWVTDAELMRSDRALEPTIGTNLAIEHFRRVLEIDPKAGYALLFLGFMLYSEDQAEAALEFFDQLVALTPDEYRAHHYRYLALDALGWRSPAEEALQEAFARRQTSCALYSLILDVAAYQEEYLTPERVPGPVLSCPSTIETLARDYDLPRGNLDDAIERYQGLVARFPTRIGAVLTLAQLLGQRGDVDEALTHYQRASDLLDLERPSYVAERVDILLAAGRYEDAKALLDDALKTSPSDIHLIELAQHFGYQGILAEMRMDGLEVVQDYLSDETRDYQHSAFLLLDYAAFRYFEDGSGLSVTHQITRVLNKDGKNRHGEVHVPSNAIVTRLRTIKADGVTTIEPEVIPNKPSVSMPNLEVGDFIEFEYIMAENPRVAGGESFVVPRWYFQIYDAPLIYSDVVIEVPSGVEPVMDIRGSAPAPEVTQRGDFTRYRFLMEEMLDPRPEPLGPSMLEIVPSVQLGYAIDLESRRQGIRNGILKSVKSSAYLEDALILATAGVTEPREIARRVFKFVKAEIAEETDTYFGMPASWVWTSRAGSRFSLLKALLDMAEVPNEVVLVKPFGMPEEDNAIPDLAFYTDVVLRVDVGGSQPLWLDPTQTHAKFDYVRPGLQGRPGVSLAATPEQVIVDTYDADFERQVMRFDLVLDEQGAVSGQGTEASDGDHGIGLRNFIARFRNDPDEVKRRLAEYLVPYFGDVEVTDYTFEGYEQDGRASVSYDFEADNYARVASGSLDLQTVIFADSLADQLAFLPSRTQPLLIDTPLSSSTEISVTIPESMRFDLLPEESLIEGPFGRFERRVEVEGQRVTLYEKLDVPMQRVSPETYEDFQRFATKVDQAQLIRLFASPAK